MNGKELIKKSIERFNIWSNRYDGSVLQFLLFHPTHKSLDKIIIPYFEKGKKVLDVACGTGQFVIKTQKRNPDILVYGIDNSIGMIKQAKLKAPNINWTICSAEKITYADNMFDIVTCSHAFHHFQNQDKAIAEMYRVLKPGGLLVIADGYKRGIWGWLIFNIVELVEGKVHHTDIKERSILMEKYHFIYSHVEVNPLVPTLITIGVKT